MIPGSDWAIWGIAGCAIAGVILRPRAWPEFVWAVAGAALLVMLRLLSPAAALSGIASGGDVYLFLTGMMLLAELARLGGLFDWLAAHAARAAHGSAQKLFSLVFAVGTAVTIILSNDATAVVLTPAVAAVTRAAGVEKPLPYLFACAFIANAASFVLPISNPANLVIYGSHMPALLNWLPAYAGPSALSVLTTYATLRWSERRHLQQQLDRDIHIPTLSSAGRRAAIGIGATSVALLAASAFGVRLGLPTFAAGAATAILVLTRADFGAQALVRGISWGILPLVAGLFVLVQGLQSTGLIGHLAVLLQAWSSRNADAAASGTGVALAVACNLMNNLPAGLLAGRVMQATQLPDVVRRAVLIGVDLGPNLSVTGSLATILWLTALRREEIAVSAWSFLKLGALVMPPALLLALAAILLPTRL